MRSIYDPNKKLFELACPICETVVCSIYADRTTKPEDLPEVICKKRHGSCVNKFRSALVNIEEVKCPTSKPKRISTKTKKNLTDNGDGSPREE